MISSRYEKKFFINRVQFNFLLNEVEKIGVIDRHAKNGFYEVNSIYFDTPELLFLRTKIEGEFSHEKIRVRSYKSKDIKFLEWKAKYNNLCVKERVPLDNPGDFMRTLFSFKTSGFKKNCLSLCPSLDVSYRRVAYNVLDNALRINFDYNIKFRRIPSFGSEKLPYIFLDVGILMEVKYIDVSDFKSFLPLLANCSIEETTFSKYCNSFLYEGGAYDG